MKPISGSSKTVKRAYKLVDLLLQEMYAGLKDPVRRSSEEWDHLFGAKQSMIANLQKLVSTMSALPEPVISTRGADVPPAVLSPTEMAMLKAWLEEEGR